MARFRVIQENGSGWKITKNGTRLYKKTYKTKQQALNSARSAASEGDSVQGQKLDGQWDNERTKGMFGPDGDR